MGSLSMIKQSPLTIILIVLCLGLYVPDMLGMNLSNYMAVGPGSLQTEPWTLVTAMFAHGSLMHLVFNMISLWYMGTMLESMQGTSRFALLYFGSGIVGDLAFSLFANGYAVGASGAIFGLMGAFIVLVIVMRKEPGMRSMLGGLVAMVAINIINTFRPGIALEAHFGGLATGALIELLFLFVAGRKTAAKSASYSASKPSGASIDQDNPLFVQGASQGAPAGMVATPDGYRPAIDVYNEAVNKKRMAKRSKILAIVLSLALTAAAFGAMTFAYMGLDFSEARVIGSDAPRVFDAQDSSQWAGDDFVGLVQIPSDWAAEHADSVLTDYAYSYSAPEGQARTTLTARFVTGSYKEAAEQAGDAQPVKLGSTDALRVETAEDAGGKVSYYIDRSALMQEGTQAYTVLTFEYDGEKPAWIDESVAAYVAGQAGGDGGAWIIGKLEGSATLGQQATQWAGDEKYGYVQLPTDWSQSIDTSNGHLSYVQEAGEGSDIVFSTMQFMDYPASWSTLQSGLDSSYDDVAYEHVCINGVDAHLARVATENDGAKTTEVICYMSPTGSVEDAYIVYFWFMDEAPLDCEEVLATFIPSKQ